MCSDQLSLFSDDMPEIQVTQKKEIKVVNTTEIKPEPKPQKIEITINMSKEDKALLEIDQEIENLELENEDKLKYLEKIKEIASSCEKCKLAKGRTKLVYSDGNPFADIMIIGEGPGENEDLTGIPFVGKAGQFLTKIIESVGINREKDTYIANIVKCRPPNNRAPEEDEMKACWGYLERQIEIVNPKIILLAGATAMKGILKKNVPISKARGEWIKWKDRDVIVIFHPSYLLRNPSRDVGSPKWLMWQDVKSVKNRLDELRQK